MSRLRAALRIVTFGMLAWAVLTELRKPREQRRWNGTLAGIVPYDLRLPTIARVRKRWWNPNDERVFTPHVFGVGWSVNLPRAFDLLRPRDQSIPDRSADTLGDSPPAERPRPD